MSLGERWAAWRQKTTGGEALYPLAVLFGLNMTDELDRQAFGVLLPEVRDHFETTNTVILSVVSLSLLVAFVLAIPIGFYGDRGRRTLIAGVGAAGWAGFSILTGLAPTLWVLAIARGGAGFGRAVNDPVHNSLIADYYDIPVRPRAYAVHRYANAAGVALGSLIAGQVAERYGWRTPFFVCAAITAVFVAMTVRMREPNRGSWERRAAGSSVEVINTEEEPPSWAESWRIIWQMPSARRVFTALPFLAIAIIGLAVLGGIFYEEVFDLNEGQRGNLSAAVDGSSQLIGLMLGLPLATRLMAKGPSHIMTFLSRVGLVIAAAWVMFALAPNLATAVVGNGLISACFFLLVPGMFAMISLVIPAKVRSFGFAVGSLFILPGLLILPFVGWVADTYGIRQGMLAAVPVFLIGGYILSTARTHIEPDIQKVWVSAAARAEVAYQRREGKVKLVLARGIDVHYDQVQVLFGVNLEIEEGEIVALLGTNGAGKSTLLKAMSGLVQASAGSVIFDGRDMTHTPPDEVAARGISQVPGGQGVFTHLTVGENLRLAGWLQRRKSAELKAQMTKVLETFPALRNRLDEPAGNLSGGQQQMLTLGMAFLGKPRLLMIDELSLGLAPTIVTQLLEMVRMLRAQGTTIILVEQSVNVALSVAERAYFMEKGEIRFEGPTSELLARPDLLRSVFFAAAKKTTPEEGTDGDGARAVVAALDGPDVDPETPPVLEVREIVRSFGGVRALDGVSFNVMPHEILGFIGPNGAGKTTLFDVISGFTPEDGGTIRLRTDGELYELHGTPTHQRSWRGLGRSFQDGRLFPGLTVGETIAVSLEQQVEVRDPIAATLHLPAVRDSEDKIAATADELIDLLGLGAYRDKFVRELSTGTRRIVDLACVLGQRPSVVLLDEPSSGIAQREAEALGPVLRRVRRELGAALLVIEHDLPLLLSIADRIVALDLGRVVVDGPPYEVIDHPAVVASYLGDDHTAIARSDAAVLGGG